MGLIGRVRLILAIWAAKVTYLSCRAVGSKGTSKPGQIARAIYPGILPALARQVARGTAVTTGTNGKTATNNLLASILRAAGHRVICNGSGANMPNGIVWAYVGAAGPFGGLRADFACLEVDEGALGLIAGQVRPTLFIVTNVLPDQTDRYAGPDKVYAMVAAELRRHGGAFTILNADDPVSSAMGAAGDAAYYSVAAGGGKTAEGRDPEPIAGPTADPMAGPIAVPAGSSGAAAPSLRLGDPPPYCKLCGGVLGFTDVRLGWVGDYACASCGYANPEAEMVAEGAVSSGGSSSFGIRHRRGGSAKGSGGGAPDMGAPDGARGGEVSRRVSLGLRGPHNVYNALAAALAASKMGITLEAAADGLSAYAASGDRVEAVRVGPMEVAVLMGKNPASVGSAMEAMAGDARPKDALLAVNDDVRDGRDVSWLWDSGFVRLAELGVESVVVSGSRAHDLNLRLLHALGGKVATLVRPDPREAVRELASRAGPGRGSYVIANYTANALLRDVMRRMGAPKSRVKTAAIENDVDGAAESREARDPIAAGPSGGRVRSPAAGDADPAAKDALTIYCLYPSYLGAYGDKGNVECLVRRVRDLGMEARVVAYEGCGPLSLADADIAFIGDSYEGSAAEAHGKLSRHADALRGFVESSGAMLAVGFGLRMLGTGMTLSGDAADGLGILGLRSEAADKRRHGYASAHASIGGRGFTLVGYENASARTYMDGHGNGGLPRSAGGGPKPMGHANVPGACAPLAKVGRGYGNNGEDGLEGVVYKGLIGTNLHGPVLAYNPELSDFLIGMAVRRRHGKGIAPRTALDAASEKARQTVIMRIGRRYGTMVGNRGRP